MKKSLLGLILIFTVLLMAVVILPAPVSAATEGIYTYTVSDGKATITKCNQRASGTIEIPEALGGYPVTTIGDYAFAYCDSLTNINIPNSVTTIGEGAFRYCDSLTNINIPAGVTTIGEGAFMRCKSLASINIPVGVTTIGNYAFKWCDNLTSINIPNSITTIGDYAFADCESLTSINIPNSVTTIGDYAFRYCYSLTSIIVDENNAYYSSIDGNLFNKNKTTLIQYAIGKTEVNYTVPAGVTTIGERAFRWCDNLTSINIPNSITTIGDYAFAGCESLTSINIPNSVTTIGESAFRSCYSLASINIPNSVTTIGIYAFDGCESLTSINIPNSVTTIGDFAFSDCRSLTSINIPNSVTNIGDFAFVSCGLTSINIPVGVTTIGKYAFSDCYSLTDVYYRGSETDWSMIDVGDGNEDLINANIIFNFDDRPANIKSVYCRYAEDKVTAEISFNYINKAGTLLVAVYDGSKLITLKSKSITTGDTETAVEIDADESYIGYDVKVFYWESFCSLSPLAKVSETKIV